MKKILLIMLLVIFCASYTYAQDTKNIHELTALSERPRTTDEVALWDLSTGTTKRSQIDYLLPVKDVDNYGGLEAAITAIGATEATVVITTPQSLTANREFVSTLSVIVLEGGSIDQGSYTLTISGFFSAGLYQVFTGTADVVFDSAEVIDIIPHWFNSDPYTNAFEAIRAAMRAAIASTAHGARSVYIPAGDYTIDTTGVFSDIDATSKSGIKIRGAGWFSTRLILSPSGSDLWFYNNVATTRMQFAVFEDIGFYGMSGTPTYGTVSDNAKGFRIYSATHEQGFKFVHCLFSGLHTGFETAGTNLASEIEFSQCKFSHIKDVVYYINNIGSLNHEFISTSMETIWGDFIRVGTSGGGAVKVYGGSWIAQTGAAYSNADEYVLDIPAAAAVGSNASIFTFNGIRFENTGNNAMLVRHAGGEVHATFRDCIFWSSSVTAIKTDWVKITLYCSILFDACAFSWGDTSYYENYSLDSSTQYGQPGKVKWQNCLVHDDLSEHITFTSNYGRASAVGCYGHSVGALTEMLAVNFDVFGLSTHTDMIGGANDNDVPLKTVSIMYLYVFPYDNSNESTVKLPVGALIKAIRVQKNAQGSSASEYCLHVGNDDKSTVYVSSITEDQNHTHRIDYERGSTSIAQITTRTDDDTAVLTFQGGNHSISEGDTVNVNWVVAGTSGRRRAMTVSAISCAAEGKITITLDGGEGDVFPAANSDCYISSVTGFIDVGATDNERIVRMWSSNGDKSTAGGAEPHSGGYAIVEYY